MVGLDDHPGRSGEICVTEMFGNAVEPRVSTAVGMGLKAIRDPDLADDFEAVRLPIDVGEFHTYAVDWTPERADFLVDGTLIRSCARPPIYPMQLMLAVFDFPDWSTGHDADAVPSLQVDYVRGYQR
jgi:beta-glucanase (GH16 family)